VAGYTVEGVLEARMVESTRCAIRGDGMAGQLARGRNNRPQLSPRDTDRHLRILLQPRPQGVCDRRRMNHDRRHARSHVRIYHGQAVEADWCLPDQAKPHPSWPAQTSDSGRLLEQRALTFSVVLALLAPAPVTPVKLYRSSYARLGKKLTFLARLSTQFRPCRY
jgi:hypothetical protein